MSSTSSILDINGGENPTHSPPHHTPTPTHSPPHHTPTPTHSPPHDTPTHTPHSSPSPGTTQKKQWVYWLLGGIAACVVIVFVVALLTYHAASVVPQSLNRLPDPTRPTTVRSAHGSWFFNMNSCAGIALFLAIL